MKGQRGRGKAQHRAKGKRGPRRAPSPPTSDEQRRQYHGVEWDEFCSLWYAIADISVPDDIGAFGWALSAEDAAWIREGVIVFGEQLSEGGAPPRNFPEATAEAVETRLEVATGALDEWRAAENRGRLGPRRLLRFNVEELEREFDGGALGDSPVLAKLIRSVRRGDLVLGESVTLDFLRALGEDQLRRVSETNREEAVDETGVMSPLERITLTAGLLWVESGRTEIGYEFQMEDYATSLGVMAAMELARRHGYIEFESDGRLRGSGDVMARATEKGMKLARWGGRLPIDEGAGSPPESVN